MVQCYHILQQLPLEAVSDSSPIFCLHFIHQPTSPSHRGANWHEGSTCTKSPVVAFSLLALTSPTWARSFTLYHHNRVYEQKCWMGMLLRTPSLDISLNASAPSHPTSINESRYTKKKKKRYKGKKCCIESILTPRTEILVLPFFEMWHFDKLLRPSRPRDFVFCFFLFWFWK